MPRRFIPYRRELKRPSQSLVDGDSHYSDRAQEYDERRTMQLQAENVKVVRFSNTEVMQDFEGVCGAILRIIAKP